MMIVWTDIPANRRRVPAVARLAFAAAVAALGTLIAPAARAQHALPLSVVRPRPDSAPRALVRPLGDVESCHAWACDQAASVGLELSPRAPWRLGMGLTAGRSVLAGGDARVDDRRIDLLYGPARRTVWIGYGVSTEATGGAASRLARLEYGTSVGWRSLTMDASIGTGAAPTRLAPASREVKEVFIVVDSASGAKRADTVRRVVTDSGSAGRARWTSATVRFGWTGERWSAAAVVGRLAFRGDAQKLWGRLDGSRTLGRHFALHGTVGTVPDPIGLPRASPHLAVSVGLLATTAWFSSAPPDPAVASTTDTPFEVRALGAERYRLVIRVPRATRVEVASDLTEWRPVAMRRERDDRWVVELSASAGVHQVSVRADDGPWAAPLGLTPVDDDYGGTAGAFVVR